MFTDTTFQTRSVVMHFLIRAFFVDCKYSMSMCINVSQGYFPGESHALTGLPRGNCDATKLQRFKRFQRFYAWHTT